ncbi:MAG: hypothetical protein IT479_02435 [Xanthomonadales bacterium]|nr:hypothetical protein [Xanthomonadales bacterium]MCC6592106.1 hypothetical protein [Xanthomonadales bacterium]MCE7932320.1 hypothetical protein [Xanthomonadales bacterium PRO6]
MSAAVQDAMTNRRASHEQAQQAAAQLWGQSPPAGAHPWLAATCVAAHGLRQRSGRLLVPMCDSGGTLWNLQFIGAGGATRILHGGRVFGLHHRIGWPVRGVQHVAEDYVTAARVHAATGQPCAVAFMLWNLRPVALALRALDPSARFTIWLPTPPPGRIGNYRGALSAAEAAAGAVSGAVAMLRGAQ